MKALQTQSPREKYGTSTMTRRSQSEGKQLDSFVRLEVAKRQQRANKKRLGVKAASKSSSPNPRRRKSKRLVSKLVATTSSFENQPRCLLEGVGAVGTQATSQALKDSEGRPQEFNDIVIKAETEPYNEEDIQVEFATDSYDCILQARQQLVNEIGNLVLNELLSMDSREQNPYKQFWFQCYGSIDQFKWALSVKPNIGFDAANSDHIITEDQCATGKSASVANFENVVGQLQTITSEPSLDSLGKTTGSFELPITAEDSVVEKAGFAELPITAENSFLNETRRLELPLSAEESFCEETMNFETPGELSQEDWDWDWDLLDG